jgi:pyruvate dehydrogenase (quinone)
VTKKVTDQIAGTLATVGIERIYGVVGDSFNGITDSLPRQERIRWVHMRNEEAGCAPQ